MIRQENEDRIGRDRASDSLCETLEQILQCRNGFQDGCGFIHGRTKVEPPCAEKEFIGQTLRNSPRGSHGERHHDRGHHVGDRLSVDRKRAQRHQDKPPNQSVESEKVGGKNRIGGHAPKEKPDLHDLPSCDAVGDDQAENYDPEWRDCHRHVPLYKKQGKRNQRGQRCAAGNHEL